MTEGEPRFTDLEAPVDRRTDCSRSPTRARTAPRARDPHAVRASAMSDPATHRPNRWCVPLAVASLDALIDEAVPEDDPDATSRSTCPLPLAEVEVVDELRAIAAQEQPMVQMIGLGYYDTFTPAVIQRECSRTPVGTRRTRRTSPRSARAGSRRCSTSRPMVEDLTGAADGQRLPARRRHCCRRGHDDGDRAHPRDRTLVVVDADVFPQTIAVLQTRARAAWHRRRGASI